MALGSTYPTVAKHFVFCFFFLYNSTNNSSIRISSNMKVILMGATGFIGREVLDQCLKNSSISAVVAVSRSDLQIVDPKLKISIIDDKDFLKYPDSLLRDIKDADACMW